MLTIREGIRTGAAIIAGIAGLGLMRFVFIDYVPPEDLIRDLERSMFVTTRMRKPAMVVYAVVSIIMMAVFFRFVQQRWPKRRSFARSNSLNKTSRQLSPARARGGYQA
jgi:hypothetical protein